MLTNKGIIMIKRMLPHLFLLVLAFSFSQASWSADAPNGFRDITWGTPLSGLSGMVVKDDSGQVKYYRRAGDQLSLGEAKLEQLSYGFYNGAFYSVLIEFKGDTNFEKARTYLLKTYGKTARGGSEGTNLTWETVDSTTVNLKYNKSSQFGYVFLFNKSITR